MTSVDGNAAMLAQAFENAALKHDGILIIDQRNYDAILDDGFSTKHAFYYCGDQVTAVPEHVDEGLKRFKYTFPDASDYTLNMFPLREAYMRRLLDEAGFQRTRTYGDFQETFEDSEPDFLIHVADKAFIRAETVEPSAPAEANRPAVARIIEEYYDSPEADNFYFNIWGGEDIHVGLYEETADIRTASRRTVEAIVARLTALNARSRVLDIGAGYGGSARFLAKTHGCDVTCLNISDAQNDTNRFLNRRQGLARLVSVVHGSFEDFPSPDSSVNIVWSQDAILHSGDRERVFAEVLRVLEPGGDFVFTDPMQADDVPAGVLQPVYDRIHLRSLGSFRDYRDLAERLGFETVSLDDRTANLRTHYRRVGEELRANYDDIVALSSRPFVDRMLVGLDNWVAAADSGWLAWGVLHFRKR